MTALQRLDHYLARVHRRLWIFTTWRGLAISVLCALALTLILTWIGNQYRFAAAVIPSLRFTLFSGIACALVFALALPLCLINRRRTVGLIESQVTGFGQRLITIMERHDSANPFTDLLAEDSMLVASANPPQALVPQGPLVASILLATAAAVAIFLMVTSAPGYLGYGASLLWKGTPRTTVPLYDIAVLPGNTTVRRRTDQVISAQLRGFSTQHVTLHARYRDSLKWDAIQMQPQPSGSGYQLLFAGLSDSLEYFVEAGGSVSRHFTLAVKDLPAVKRLRVEIHFPSAIGLPDTIEDPGGDIRAIEGSHADLRVLTDKPLQDGIIVMDNGTRIPLVAAGDNWLTGTLPIRADGSYHIAALDHQDPIRISDNFIIEARQDEPPTVSIVKPGRDPGVSPIEELPVTVNASDDFGLRSVDLHYSVNGGQEQVKRLSNVTNSKQVEGKATLTLEDFKLAPGDLVSLYATATDATHTSRSDIVFAKVEPFDLKFCQSQQAGGGGGGGGDQDSKISERQKDIIAATWNQLKDPAHEAAAVTQNARFLSDLESKLSDQAKALSERMANRELGEDSQQFKDFSKSMLDASAQMSQATSELKPGKWTPALGPEQKALQSLLHAEALFRDIQVSFGQQSNGGAGQGGQERDLARLFDLELDTAKNQYESGQSAAQPQEDSQKQLNDQLERLKELARRQQSLANEQHVPQQQFQQRWEEEQLRREAEQLRQQLQQQLSENSQQNSPASASSSSGRSGSQGSGQQQGAPRHSANAAQRDSLKHAMDALAKAENEMRAASSKADAAAQQRATNDLAQSQNILRDMLKQQANEGLSDLARQASQLASNQKDLGQRVKNLYGVGGVDMSRTDENGTPIMPEMNGPGYGGYYRRRQQPTPEQPATKQEKSVAEENDKLADKMQQLQTQLQQQAQALAEQRPETARKMRKALSDAEQEEIAVRMRKSSEWLRQGFGSKTWPIEDGITAATQRLSRQLNAARQSGDGRQTPSQPSSKDALGQALAEVQSLREQLESQSKSSSPGDSSGDAGDHRQPALDQLGGLRSAMGRDDRQLSGYVNDAIGAVRRINGQAGLLDARLNGNALVSLERLEMELARRMEQKSGARTGAPENIPESYRDAVATYFRTLSK